MRETTMLRKLICLASLVALVRAGIQERQDDTDGDGQWNRRRAKQSVKRLNSKVYFNGGELSNYVSETDTTGTGPSSAMNETLSLPLDESWDISTVSFNHITQDQPVSVSHFALWADQVDRRLYRWGGQLASNQDMDEDDVGLWMFTPDHSDNGTWIQPSIGNPIIYDSIASGVGGAAVSCKRKGYYIGGYGLAASDPDFADAKVSPPLPGILSYDMSHSTWANDSTAPLAPPYGAIMTGQAACTNAFQQEEELILSIGGRTTDQDNASEGKTLVPMDNITFWDTAQERWMWQEATGDIPQRSEKFCAVGAESQDGTYEVFVYGGKPGTDRAHGEMHILSLPGFQWFEVDVDSPERMHHACDYIGGGQMISTGGVREEWEWDTSDDWRHSLGVFDMTNLTWKDGFETGLPTYQSPQIVKDWYANGGMDSVQWASDEVRNLFVSDSPEDGSGDGSGDGDSGSSSTTGAIAGGVVGGVAGIALIGALAWFLLRRRRQKQAQNELPESQHMANELPEQSTGSEYKHSSPTTWGSLSPQPPVEMPNDDHARHEMATEGNQRAELQG